VLDWLRLVRSVRLHSIILDSARSPRPNRTRLRTAACAGTAGCTGFGSEWVVIRSSERCPTGSAVYCQSAFRQSSSTPIDRCVQNPEALRHLEGEDLADGLCERGIALEGREGRNELAERQSFRPLGMRDRCSPPADRPNTPEFSDKPAGCRCRARSFSSSPAQISFPSMHA
jgi:hypothetical protein